MSCMWAFMSRVVMPFAYIEMIFSSTPLSTVSYFLTATGSKSAFRSRGTTSVPCPRFPFIVFFAVAVTAVFTAATGRAVFSVPEMLSHFGLQHGLQSGCNQFLQKIIHVLRRLQTFDLFLILFV